MTTDISNLCAKCGQPNSHPWHDPNRWPGRMLTSHPHHAFVARNEMTLDDLTSYRAPVPAAPAPDGIWTCPQHGTHMPSRCCEQASHTPFGDPPIRADSQSAPAPEATREAAGGGMSETVIEERVRRPVRETLPPDAFALQPVRIIGDECVLYTGVTFPKNRWGGIEWELRKLQATGGLAADGTWCLLDVLNEQGDIIADYPVTLVAFNRLKRSWKFTRESRAATTEGGAT